MGNVSFVEQHILDCLRAAVAEARGEQARARRLRAQGKLRLVCMSDDEVWELAGRTCCPPRRSLGDAYRDIKRTIEEYKNTTDEWLHQAFDEIPTGTPQ